MAVFVLNAENVFDKIVLIYFDIFSFMVIVNAMAAFKPKVVVGNIPPGVTKEEVAILLESHIGGGVAKKNDPDTSQNSGKLLLIMASEDGMR